MNDERPIEKLLRRHAQKRRDEAGEPPVLHPATRRLLQGEVKRQFPKPATEDKPSLLGFFGLLAGRWIYAVGLFVVLGLTAVVMLPSLFKSERHDTLALKSSSGKAVESEAAAVPPPPTITPTMPPAEALPVLTAADERVNAPRPASRSLTVDSRPRDQSSVRMHAVTNGVVGGSLLAGGRADADALRKVEESRRFEPASRPGSSTRSPAVVTVQSSPPRPTAPPVAADSLAFKRAVTASESAPATKSDDLADARQGVSASAAAPKSVAPGRAAADKAFVARSVGVEKDTGAVYSQAFANVATGQLSAAKAKAVTPVLVNFQIQQAGNELRVVDSDGSTYRGTINTAQDSYGISAATKEAAAYFESANRQRTQTTDNVAATPQPSQSFFYRVEGTNRTLNQNVIFTWNFVDTTNAIAASDAKAMSNVPNQEAATLPSQFPVMLQNSFLNGRAQLGPTQQIEINAVPVKP